MKQHLTPKELSLAIGASESSLKRWADDGALRAVRTAGGHRRITIDEAVRFIRQSGLKVIDPAAIGLPPMALPSDRAASVLADDMTAALIDGDGPKVKGLLVGGHLAGQSAGFLMDQLLTPALHHIGALWRHDVKGIYIEHRATALCIEALNQLVSLFPEPDADAPVAVGCALATDPYALPTLMAGLTLAAEGWRITNLGPQTPVESLIHAAADARAKLIWISASVDMQEQLRPADLNELHQTARSLKASIVVGGREAGSLHWPAHGAALHVNSMSELAAFAAGLRAQ